MCDNIINRGENSMCEYCNNGNDGNIDIIYNHAKTSPTKKTFLYIHNNKIAVEAYLSHYSHYSEKIINYCPMCGRKL